MKTRKRRILISLLAIISVLYLGRSHILRSPILPSTGSQNRATSIDLNSKPFFEEKVFGKSENGKDIKGYVIGNGNETYFLMGAIHGNEMGSASLLEKLAAHLKENPRLLNANKKIIILPVANPDGYYDRLDKLNARGVNLNLNFQTSDWQPHGPDENQPAGSNPFSENESQVIKKIIEDYQPKMMVSYHAQGGLVSPENNVDSKALGALYSELSGYSLYKDDDWDYPGTATKWFSQSTGKAAITVELSTLLSDDWEINESVLLEILK